MPNGDQTQVAVSKPCSTISTRTAAWWLASLVTLTTALSAMHASYVIPKILAEARTERTEDLKALDPVTRPEFAATMASVQTQLEDIKTEIRTLKR